MTFTFPTEHEMKETYRQVSPWVEWLARLGYAAKGVVYVVIGLLAIQAALGSGGATAGSRGALYEIAAQPLGQVLLAVVAIGLVGYVLWRFVQAIVDPDNKGTDLQGIAQRIGYVTSGIAYAGLALTAAQILFRFGGGGGNNGAEDWTARALSQPFGRWLVAIGGLILLVVAFFQVYMAYKARFRNRLKRFEMGASERTWALRSGRLGYAARGVVYGIIGVLLIQAARQYDPQKAGGLGDALNTLARQPYGWLLLGIVAVGLVAYGIFAFVLARYRYINVG